MHLTYLRSSADLPATLADFHAAYRVVSAHTSTAPTPREQLIRDCVIVIMQPPENEYKPEQANAILRVFSEAEVVEAFEWLKGHSLISRVRRMSVRSFHLAATFHRTVDPRLPPALVTECAEWLAKQRQQLAAPPAAGDKSVSSIAMDRFVAGGHVASLVEQCFVVGAVGLSAHLTATPAPGAASAAAAAALLSEKTGGGAGKEADDEESATGLAELQLRVAPAAVSAAAPPVAAPRLVAPVAPPSSPPPPPALKFEAPALEKELRGHASLATLTALYRAAEAGGADGVALDALRAACAPSPLAPLLSELEARWLLVRVAAHDHPRYVARQHARQWCIVWPPAAPVVMRPWLKPDGTLHRPFVETLQARLLAAVTRAPGVSVVRTPFTDTHMHILGGPIVRVRYAPRVDTLSCRTLCVSNCNPRSRRSTRST